MKRWATSKSQGTPRKTYVLVVSSLRYEVVCRDGTRTSHDVRKQRRLDVCEHAVDSRADGSVELTDDSLPRVLLLGAGERGR